MALHCPHSLVPIAGFFDGISAEELESLGDVYSPGVRFEDPLHDVQGMAPLREIYRDLLQKLEGLKLRRFPPPRPIQTRSSARGLSLFLG